MEVEIEIVRISPSQIKCGKEELSVILQDANNRMHEALIKLSLLRQKAGEELEESDTNLAEIECIEADLCYSINRLEDIK